MRALQWLSGADLAEGDEGRAAAALEAAEHLVEIAELVVHEEEGRLGRCGSGDEEASLGVALDEPGDERLDVTLVALVLEVRERVLERRDLAMRLPETHLVHLTAQIAQDIVVSEELVQVGQVQPLLGERNELRRSDVRHLEALDAAH